MVIGSIFGFSKLRPQGQSQGQVQIPIFSPAQQLPQPPQPFRAAEKVVRKQPKIAKNAGGEIMSVSNLVDDGDGASHNFMAFSPEQMM